MQTNEKKDIKESLRKNRVEQAELNRQADEIKEKRIQLRSERAELLSKAEKIGMKFGKNKESA